MKGLMLKKMSRMILFGVGVAALIALVVFPASASMEAAKKWVDEEFQPSTLSKSEQMK